MREDVRNTAAIRTAKLVLSVGVLVALSAPAASGVRPGRVRTARTALIPPVGAEMDHARGRLIARDPRSDARPDTLVLAVAGLRRGTEYTVACDDPATPEPTLEPFAVLRTGADRSARTILGAGRRRGLPHGATLEQLAGGRVEVRDEEGLLVLTGEVPSVDGSRSALADVEFRFIDDLVLEDLFDAATVGDPPPDWTVTGTEVDGIVVAVDDTVADGGSGASVRLEDGVAADPGAPAMSRAFTPQDLYFSVEFTLISGQSPARIVFHAADSSTSPATVPTGLGDGLGLYEDGTLGFGIGDAIQETAADTAYHVRVDFFLDDGVFDVSVDGTPAVTGRDLGFTGTSLDLISFGGTPDTTGTAWVDTVRVLHRTKDLAPTADAGPDQVIECAGETTAVTLDGSASADPEGAELTYTWTGDFVEGTAEGPNPTVHFSGLGSHTATLVVNDGFLDSAPDDVAVELQDTLPPELSVTGLPNDVWPPNHKLVLVTPVVVATDICDGDDVTLTLEITSNEPDDGLGDGSTTGDIVIRSPDDFDLRAERSGTGSGRIYTLVWTATDQSGNQSTFETTIRIPHDRRRR